MPIFPVYALLFADAGLSLADISLLFVLWSVVGIVLEVPSGAWADTVSRRLLLALGSVTYAAGFACWVLVPTFAGFAAGFVLWGLSGALTSGTYLALAYDELAALGAPHRYARLIGLGRALAITAMMLASVAATPLLAVGGYDLVGWASVGVCGVQLLVVLSLPSAPKAVSADDVDELQDLEGTPGFVPPRPGVWHRWRHALRTGVTEAGTSALVRGAVLASGAILALQVLDEYFGLLFEQQGAALVLVPVLYALTSLGEIVGALVATRAGHWRPAYVGAAVSLAGALVAVAALTDDPYVAALTLTLGYGLVQLAVVVSEVRLQDSIEAGARATVISTSNVLSEVLQVLAFVGFALAPTGDVAAPVLVAGLVAVLLGPLVVRWLPPAPRPPEVAPSARG
ncbi:MFS transporter [Nocardioides aequoreus]|uniref:MFS transporter n=1 Tax=Nocardioides aequoreus TaxID=397278 RepID=UPI0006924515|nr:MFS transporter [Nocardioides aequoreus]